MPEPNRPQYRSLPGSKGHGLQPCRYREFKHRPLGPEEIGLSAAEADNFAQAFAAHLQGAPFQNGYPPLEACLSKPNGRWAILFRARRRSGVRAAKPILSETALQFWFKSLRRLCVDGAGRVAWSVAVSPHCPGRAADKNLP